MARHIDADYLKAGFEEDGHLSPYIEQFIDACPTVGEWISVKDGLPEDFIDHSKEVRQIKVLVAIKAKNGWTVRTQMRCKDVHSRFYGASPDIIWYWRHFFAGDLTHWMPLPEPPKEES